MSTTLVPGMPAPDFSLNCATGEAVSLASLRGAPVIVFFYPAAGTPGCTKEACDFRDSLAPLQAAGYQVVGISPDDPGKLRAFAADHALTYPLLSDPDHTVATAYGAYGDKQLYGRTVRGIIRSTFVIDAQGVVTHVFRGVKATGHVARLRRELGLSQ